jgi:SAM-dependent methyltransferase
MSNALLEAVYPEAAFGGFSRVDGTVAFYSRVQSLIPPGAVVLDVGCGRGKDADDPCEFRRGLCDLHGAERKVIGIDVDPAGDQNRLIDEFRPITDLNHWPVAGGEIDVLVANSVLEHVQNPSSFFAEAYRVLRPGGVACLRTYNKWGYVGICARLVPNRLHSKVTSFAQSDREDHDVFPTVYCCNTPGAIRRAMSRQGFTNCVYTLETEPNYLRFSPVLYRVGALVHKFIPPSLRWTILAFGRKP